MQETPSAYQRTYLDGLALVEGVLLATLNYHGHQRAEGVGDGVGQRSQSGEAQLERQGRHIGARRGELVAHVGVREVEHGSGKDGAVVVDAVDHQTVGEGTDAQLLKKSRLGGAHLYVAHGKVQMRHQCMRG